jgi:hypothetical protein
MVIISGLFTFTLTVSLAELPAQLPSTEADVADIAPPGLAERAANCVDDAWTEMGILAPTEGFVSALGTPLELRATFPACLDMPGAWASFEIRYLGKTTKRVQHREVALTVECELLSGERCRGRASDMVEVRVSPLRLRLPNRTASSCFPSRSGRIADPVCCRFHTTSYGAKAGQVWG